MRLLDLYCGAGLAAGGYAEAGCEVTGIDINPQPEYPHDFYLYDALEWLERRNPVALGYDVVHASPPCQLHTRAGKLRDAQGGTSRYEDLLTPTLDLLRQTTIPWVVENVPDAKPLMMPREGEVLTVLCGSMFGLGVQRHRLFLSNVDITPPPGGCQHHTFELDPITGRPRPWGVYHVMGDSIPSGGRTVRDLEHGKEVMGVRSERQMTWEGLKEGVPPAYTRWLGAQLLALTPVRH